MVKGAKIEMQKENLFQTFSQIFIESQQSFIKCEHDLRSKCRTLSEKLSRFVENLEEDPFDADMTVLATLEEDMLHILRSVSDLENRRDLIKESVFSLQNSTKTKINRRGK